MFLIGDQRHHLNIRHQPVIGQRHTKLGLKIRENAQSPHNYLGANALAKRHRQPLVAHYPNLRIFSKGLIHQV